MLKPIDDEIFSLEIDKIKDQIKNEGFEEVAKKLSISTSKENGGDLGWVDQSVISEEFESKIINTAIGQISEPVLLPEGIVFFKVRDKRVSKKNIDLVQARQQIINSEKTKILNMYSLSHYDTLRRTIAINYY